MRPIDLVVFDLAGTTVMDDGGLVLQCLLETAAAHDLPSSPDELNRLMGLDKREVFGMLAARRHGTSAPRAQACADAAMDDFRARMLAHYQDNVRPVPGAKETFAQLRERGIKVATDTGFDSIVTDAIMRGLDWPGRLVDCVVCVTDVVRGRPAPYMIFHAMQTLGVLDVRRVMKVGDSPADLEEGSNAGCGEVVGVLSGAHDVTSLGSRPHTRLLRSVADLPALFRESSP